MGNRIDSRARGNAAQLLEKYKTLARDAQQAGDRVLAEYYLQFADHYFRVLAESRARFDEANPRRAQGEYDGAGASGGDGYDEDGEGDGEDADDEFAPPRQQARPREDRPREDRPQQRYEGQRDGQRDDRPRQPRDDRPQRQARDDRPQRDEGPRAEYSRPDYARNERPRQQAREDAPRDDRARVDQASEPAVESEVAQIYRDESAASEERVTRAERPTRDGVRRRLGMHSSGNGAVQPAPTASPTGSTDDRNDGTHDDGAHHDGAHALPLDALPPSITASVSAPDELPLGVEGEVVAPAPRRRGRPRKVVPDAPASEG